jgi:hypothetical protein
MNAEEMAQTIEKEKSVLVNNVAAWRAVAYWHERSAVNDHASANLGALVDEYRAMLAAEKGRE